MSFISVKCLSIIFTVFLSFLLFSSLLFSFVLPQLLLFSEIFAITVFKICIYIVDPNWIIYYVNIDPD